MFTLFTLILPAISLYAIETPALSLNQYLSQVESENSQAVASKSRVESGYDRRAEGNLITTVKLVGMAQYTQDKRPTVNPSFQGRETDSTQYSLGLEQQTPIGIRWKLSENIVHTKILGATAGFLPMSDFKDVAPRLELSVPLLRNLLGSETRALRDAKNAENEAKKQTAQAQLEQIRLQAESLYWRVGNLQELVKIQVDMLERAAKIREWAKSRLSRDLADPSDLYQAASAVKVRQIELENLKSELLTVSRQFNSLRGLNSEEVPESLVFQEVSLDAFGTLPLHKSVTRSDVKAMLAQLQTQEASSKLNSEQALPEVNLYGTAQMNGRDPVTNPAWSRGHTTSQPLYTVGISFSIPLDFANWSRVHSAHRAEVEAARLETDRKVLDLENDWAEIKRRTRELKTQLELAKELVASEKQKADYERTRLSKGRSTTQQTLLFEQDYANARLRHIQVETQARLISAQLKLYQGDTQ